MGRLIRVGFLQQNAFHSLDANVSLNKQDKMMALFLYLYDTCLEKIESKYPIRAILNTHLFDDLILLKNTLSEDLTEIEMMKQRIDEKLSKLD